MQGRKIDLTPFRVYIMSSRKTETGKMAAEKTKTGLVLEGGAMRGLFSAGIMDVLMESGVVFDGVIGVSAGAAFGCNWKSHQKGRALRYNLRFCNEKRYCSWYSLLTTGDLFGAEFCYHTLPRELDIFDGAAYESDPTAFYVVCTDARTGGPVYRRCDRADDESFEWMRASGSMPLVSRPVRIGGGLYLDGALSDSVPLRYFEELGYTRNVVILTQPEGYVKPPARLRGLVRFLLRRTPAAAEALLNRPAAYNAQLRYVEEQARSGKVFLFRPQTPLPASRLCRDPEKLQATYDAGAAAARANLAALEAFLVR